MLDDVTDEEALALQEAGYEMVPVTELKVGDVVAVKRTNYTGGMRVNLHLGEITFLETKNAPYSSDDGFVPHVIVTWIMECDDGVIRNFTYGRGYYFFRTNDTITAPVRSRLGGVLV